MSDFSLKFNDMSQLVHELAKSKGWYETPRTALEAHMLIVGEVAEASECVRDSQPPFYWDGDKPEGELVELADVVLRIMDYCAHKGWDLGSTIETKHQFNQTRPYKHGKSC